MRGKLFRVLFTTLTVLVLLAGTASATPASQYVGQGGPIVWNGSVVCDGSTIAGPVTTAGSLGGIDAVTYQNCRLPFGLTLEVGPRLPWRMTATSGSAYSIEDIELDFAGPGCAGTVSGSADASYDGSVLTVVNHATTVTYLDPVSDCLGLIGVGEPVPVLSDSYDVLM